jgi:hypothetical protein
VFVQRGKKQIFLCEFWSFVAILKPLEDSCFIPQNYVLKLVTLNSSKMIKNPKSFKKMYKKKMLPAQK